MFLVVNHFSMDENVESQVSTLTLKTGLVKDETDTLRFTNLLESLVSPFYFAS